MESIITKKYPELFDPSFGLNFKGIEPKLNLDN